MSKGAATARQSRPPPLKKGDKSLVGNKGYRRFLADPQDEGFAIDRGQGRRGRALLLKKEPEDRLPAASAGVRVS